MTHPAFKTLNVRRTSYDSIDTLRKEFTPIPSRAEMVEWLTGYAEKNRKNFLAYAKKQQRDRD